VTSLISTKMKIITKSKKSIDLATSVLKTGGLIIYPTETLYGVGVDATNPLAVEKLTAYKNRPSGKPYSVAVSDQKMAEKYVILNQTAKKLYKEFLPGPITVISTGRHNLPDGIESENGSLGIRIPDYSLVTDIVRKLGRPITATSANASYKKRPYKISDILENIGGKQKDLIDLIIDAGELPKKEPSTVIDTTLDDLVILRQGEVVLKNKNQVLSRSEDNTQNVAKELWQKYEEYHEKRPIIFALTGEMGAGKTQFTKGLAKAMGIKELVTSPTYSLENEYQSTDPHISLHHFDAWRMENSEELGHVGFVNLINSKSVIAIEWANKVSDFIRKFDEDAIIIWVKIYPGKSENERTIEWGVSK
jgi:L-threonylcarbamoyladenylate synthase